VNPSERALRRQLWATLAVIALGVGACVTKGADNPADPRLGGVASSISAADLPAPGDPARVPLTDFSELAIAVQPAAGGDLVGWCLLAALDEAHRNRGLMGVTDLHGYSGMAFVYPEDSLSAFYMKDTLIPLSIAWIDQAGSIVSTADMVPCGKQDPCPTYPPAGPYRVAIEVPLGGLPALGITEGAQVTLTGTCAPRS
jgi:hypothetical protein